MPSYFESLGEDRQRVHKALQRLIEAQQNLIRDLSATLQGHMDALDEGILRTMVFRNLFGAGSAETATTEVDVQQASRPVTDITRQLEKEGQVLKSYREALGQVESGAPLESLGKFDIEVTVP